MIYLLCTISVLSLTIYMVGVCVTIPSLQYTLYELWMYLYKTVLHDAEHEKR